MVSSVWSSRFRLCSSLFAALAILAMFLGSFWWPGSSSAWASFIRIALLLSLLASLGLFNRRSFSLNPLIIATAVLLGYMFLNSFFSGDNFQSTRRLVLICLFIAAVSAIKPQSVLNWTRIMQIGVCLATGFALFSMVNLMTHGAFKFGYREMKLATSGLVNVADFGNTIVAGMHYAFFLIAGAWLMLTAEKRRESLFWLLCCAVLAVYIYFTFARSAWMGCAAGCLLLVCVMTQGKVRRSLLIAIAVGIVAIAILGFRELMFEVNVRGVTGRNEVWSMIFSRLTDHWWFGRGAGTALGQVRLHTGQIVGNTHSLYLEVLYQLGIVGLALLVITMAFAAVSLSRALARSKEAGLWIAMLAGIAVVMVVELHTFIGTPGLVWMWLWLPLAGAIAVSREVAQREG